MDNLLASFLKDAGVAIGTILIAIYLISKYIAPKVFEEMARNRELLASINKDMREAQKEALQIYEGHYQQNLTFQREQFVHQIEIKHAMEGLTETQKELTKAIQGLVPRIRSPDP